MSTLRTFFAAYITAIQPSLKRCLLYSTFFAAYIAAIQPSLKRCLLHVPSLPPTLPLFSPL
jgi:hypothetical protein